MGRKMNYRENIFTHQGAGRWGRVDAFVPIDPIVTTASCPQLHNRPIPRFRVGNLILIWM